MASANSPPRPRRNSILRAVPHVGLMGAGVLVAWSIFNLWEQQDPLARLSPHGSVARPAVRTPPGEDPVSRRAAPQLRTVEPRPPAARNHRPPATADRLRAPRTLVARASAPPQVPPRRARPFAAETSAPDSQARPIDAGSAGQVEARNGLPAETPSGAGNSRLPQRRRRSAATEPVEEG